jgi:tetratricopeptide (TPR) repeat protein
VDLLPLSHRIRVSRLEAAGICLLLAAATIAVYSEVRHFDFVNFDDNDYVYQNAHIRAGFTAETLKWAFTSGSESFWFPLSRLSHVLDWKLFGENAGGHHLTSVLLHLLASLLLFSFLLRATGDTAPSAFVAFAFAVHPMHVESVAWVAERKDVLCTAFWFLALWNWVRYAERPGWLRYAVVLALFSCGLMAKPTIITFPFLLLLLDFWPLARLRPDTGRRWGFSRLLLLEKLPFAVFSIVGAVVTYETQSKGGAVTFSRTLPVWMRIQNALISWVVFIGKAFWPVNLSVTTPYPQQIPFWQPILAAMAIVAMSVFVLRNLRRYPFLTVGWFWYLGALVPMIGIIQAGLQARTDHATYVPFVGLFIMLGWSGSELARRWPASTTVVRALAVASCVALTVTARVQTAAWQNSETLFRHAAQAAPGNYEAYEHLGVALGLSPARVPEAIGILEESIRLRPAHAAGHLNLSTALLASGRQQEAITEIETAIRLEPGSAKAHNNLGAALTAIPDRRAEGIEEFRTAIRLNIRYAEAHCNLGIALFQTSHVPEAIEELEIALDLAPGNPQAHSYLGAALLETPGRVPEAIEHLEEVVRLRPDNAMHHTNLAIALLRVPGQTFRAVGELDEALRVDPGYATAHAVYGMVLSETPGRRDDAVAHLKAALKSTPDPIVLKRLQELEGTELVSGKVAASHD